MIMTPRQRATQSPMNRHHHFDVLVIGGGAAGLSLALRLPADLKIAIISKKALTEGSTYYAQGGIAAVLDENDSIESHVEDTIVAGAGLCDEEMIRHIAERGPENIQWLRGEGVDFTRQHPPADGLHLTREGGHSKRRVVHAADATGREVEVHLEEDARRRDNIQLLEQHNAIDLILTNEDEGCERRCVGAYILNTHSSHVETILANVTVVATGGASKVYLYTSNPDVSTGDGIAMAWRAGCRAANMEFIQFHPTCLYHPQAKSFLITERFVVKAVAAAAGWKPFYASL